MAWGFSGGRKPQLPEALLHLSVGLKPRPLSGEELDSSGRRPRSTLRREGSSLLPRRHTEWLFLALSPLSRS